MSNRNRSGLESWLTSQPVKFRVYLRFHNIDAVFRISLFEQFDKLGSHEANRFSLTKFIQGEDVWMIEIRDVRASCVKRCRRFLSVATSTGRIFNATLRSSSDVSCAR